MATTADPQVVHTQAAPILTATCMNLVYYGHGQKRLDAEQLAGNGANRRRSREHAPAQKSTATRFAQVFGDVRQGRRWGSDGASLESVSGFSHDPIAADVNLYRYCGDDPLIHTDPSGLRTCTLIQPVVMVNKAISPATATGGGFGVGVSLNPSVINGAPTSKIHCSCTRVVDVQYSCTDTIKTHYFCGISWWSRTVTNTITKSFSQPDEWDIDIAPDSVFLVGVEVPIPKTFIGVGSYYKIQPGKEQARADSACRASAARRTWPTYVPPPTTD